MEPTYTADGNGDTLLILCDPDRPFKEVDHEDLWFNHLQQYDDITDDRSHLRDNIKDYRYRLGETRVNIKPTPRSTNKQMSWKVSSEKLISESAYFRDLATQDWNEGKMSEQGYRYTITVEGWSEGALHKLMLRIHGQDVNLNELQANPELCAQLAIIVEAYQCHHLFDLSFPVVPGRYPYNENLLFSLFSSWVFRDEKTSRIEQKRQWYVDEMLTFANCKLKKLLACDQAAGDDLLGTLALTFGSWPPEEPFEGFGALNVYRALDGIGGWDALQVDDWNDQTDSSSEMDTFSEADASSEVGMDTSSDMGTSMTGSTLCVVTLKELMDDWEGLDLSDFSTDM